MSFGRFERKHDAQPMAEINMTPLIDVMLVLLVIFIITAPLLMGAIKVNLPKAGANAASVTPQSIAIVVDAAGQVFVADQPQTLPTLAQTLQTSARTNPDTEVQLRADSAVPYGRVAEVMNLAHQAGLHRIGFVYLK